MKIPHHFRILAGMIELQNAEEEAPAPKPEEEEKASKSTKKLKIRNLPTDIKVCSLLLSYSKSQQFDEL